MKKHDILGKIKVNRPWILSDAFHLVKKRKKKKKNPIVIIRGIKVKAKCTLRVVV